MVSETIQIVSMDQILVGGGILSAVVALAFYIIKGLVAWIFKDRMTAAANEKSKAENAMAFLSGRVDSLEKTQGNYVTRQELSSHLDKFESKLEKLGSRLEQKFDDLQSLIINRFSQK